MLSIISPGIRIDVTDRVMVDYAKKTLSNIMSHIQEEKLRDCITIHNTDNILKSNDNVIEICYQNGEWCVDGNGTHSRNCNIRDAWKHIAYVIDNIKVEVEN